MELTFNKSITQNLEEALKREWIETNGLGGWASSTISGVHTRKYHGLLVAATDPPVGRQVLLSKLEEALWIGIERYELGCNRFNNNYHPHGYRYLTQFSKKLFPEFVFEVAGIKLRKTVVAVNGENTTLVLYDVLQAKESFTLELTPFIASRDFHCITYANGDIHPTASFNDHLFHTQPYHGSPDLFISVPEAVYVPEPGWYFGFEYQEEQARGFDYKEDLFTPGKFSIKLQKGSRLGIIISTTHPADKNAFDLSEKEAHRRLQLTNHLDEAPDFLKILTLAADQFIVKRGENLKSIIAGYHWFSDWGRDTMISLPGLCLATDRPEDAQKILLAFSHSVSRGMLPNRFPDDGEVPEYNTVDATLWFFVAIYKYWESTRDDAFVQAHLLPLLKSILEWHYRGTRYHIHVTEDELLYAGEDGQQLTWMDARVGNWVVTPRQGKPVEVNALWYNALRIYAHLAGMSGDDEQAELYTRKASRARESFNQLFWNEERGCLYDCIGPDFKNGSIRPNQLLAISLPFALITGEKARRVLEVVEKHLYTPVGLRSLSRDHVEYRSYYTGNQHNRDGAYHQGTVWSWLLGPYIDALVKVKRTAGIQQAKKVIQKLLPHLTQAGIGTISEIFDAEAPHEPKGCIGQAWSVAEILRVSHEYHLFEAVETEKDKMVLQ